MTNTIKAIPTDYLGIGFRSKSEAMFANVLEANNLSWVYEPKGVFCDDYTPDFLSVECRGNILSADVFEYKPRTPTRAYLERLASKFPGIRRKLNCFGRVSFSVVVVDFFSDYAPQMWCLSGSGWIQSNCFKSVVTEDKFNSSRKYRYDLIQEEPPTTPKEVARIPLPIANVFTLGEWMRVAESMGGIMSDLAGLAIGVELTRDGILDVFFPRDASAAAEYLGHKKWTVIAAIKAIAGRAVGVRFNILE